MDASRTASPAIPTRSVKPARRWIRGTVVALVAALGVATAGITGAGVAAAAVAGVGPEADGARPAAVASGADPVSVPDDADPAQLLAEESGADGGAGLPPADGRLVAVWGPTGAPGRTTVAIGLAADASRFGMGTRSQRYAMLVRDRVVEQLAIDAPGEFKVSSAEHLLSLL